jgi:hypothetical protein
MELRVVQTLVAEVAEVATVGEGADRGVLEAAAASVQRLRNWLDGREVVIAGALAGVSGFPEKNLADSTRVSLRDAQRAIERAANASQAPAFADAVDAGTVSGRHLDTFTRALQHLPPEGRAALQQREQQLLHSAQHATVEEFARRMRVEVARLHTDTDSEARLARQRGQLRLRAWTDHDTQMGRWNATWDPATMLRLDSALTAMTERLSHGPPIEGCPTDPIERHEFLRAHALLALLDGGGTKMSAPEAVLVIRGSDDGTAHIDTDLPVDLPPSVIDDLLSRAEIHTVVVHDSRIVSAPGRTRLGRSARTANTAQRRALRAVYRRCAVPGCTVRIRDTEAHHANTQWANGGHTDLDNLLPLCRHHHDLAHQQHWHIHLDPNRQLTIQLTDGTVMTTGPPTLSSL